MIRKLHDWRLLFSKNSGLVSFCAAILLAHLFTPALRAQLLLPVYSYVDYWKINGFLSAPYQQPFVPLQISKNGNFVNVWWPYSISNVVLQATTDPSSGNNWVSLTNQPVESVTNDTRTVTLLPQFDKQYFRLMGVGTVQIPIFGFAIFCNGQLEFTQCPPLTILGRTHANGTICLGAALGNTLQFMKTVTTTSSINNSNLGGYTSFAVPVYSDSPPFITGVPTLNLPIGTNNTPAAVREIVNLPPVGESASSLIGQQRYHNKAAVVILVSNTTVTLTVKDQGALTGTTTNINFNSWSNGLVAERTMLAAVLPFLNLTNRFRDYRESKWVMPTQIDMGVLKSWLLNTAIVTNRYPLVSGLKPNILYVNDFRTVTNLHAVRLANGSIISTNTWFGGQPTGFTIATPNPLYVWGNYNLPNPAHAGTTNTTATFPASLVCDAITFLSPNWTDSGYGNGSTTLSSRNAASTTINAAIIAGSVYSTGSAAGQWSGGIHNLTRLLESWSGDTLTLNGSWVNLYNSVRATNQFQNPGIYYYAPTRNFSFDQNFNTAAKLPPGTPVVFGIVPPN